VISSVRNAPATTTAGVHQYYMYRYIHEYMHSAWLEYAEKLGAGSKRKNRKNMGKKNFISKLQTGPGQGPTLCQQNVDDERVRLGTLPSPLLLLSSAKVPEVVNSAWECD